MDANLHGFDVAYAIDQPSLEAALENLITDAVVQRCASMPLLVPLPAPAPIGTLQHGLLQVTSVPSSQLVKATDPNAATFVISFATTVLQLDAVPAIGVFGGVGALPPTMAGKLVITLQLSLTSDSGGGHANLQFAAPTISVANLDALPTLPLPAASDALQQTVKTAVVNAISTVLPLNLNVPFGDPGLCDIGVRSLVAKLFGQTTDAPNASLAFFMTQLASSSGDPNAIAPTDLTIPTGGLLALANPFLKQLVCCLMQQSPDIKGLPEPTTEDDSCCHWRGVDNVSLAGTSVRIDDLDVCIKSAPNVQSTITLHVKASQSGTGWTAWASVDLDFKLVADGGALSVVQENVVPHSGHDVSPWAWIIVGLAAAIGALAGFVIGLFGGPVTAVGGLWQGGVIGAAVGLALFGIVDFILDSFAGLAEKAVSGVLGVLGGGKLKLLPDAVTETFGTINEVVTVDFDDLVIGGHMQPPRRDNIVSEGNDVVLGLGDQVDLDRGVIERAGDSVAGFRLEGDLLWRADVPVRTMMARVASGAVDVGTYRTGTLACVATARLAPLARSYWSLTDADLRVATFPAARVELPESTIPSSESAYPAGARVFAVRTTAGRLAKCVAWRDSSDRLHLSYVTYQSLTPLSISAQWSTTRGPIVNTLPIAFRQTYQVARAARFDAKLLFQLTLPWMPPIPYKWLWNDQPLQSTGTLPDGTTTYSAFGSTLHLQTAMGAPLQGVLQVEVDALGAPLVATLDINEPGTETVTMIVGVQPSDRPTLPPMPVDPIAPPLHEQLAAAFSRGMGIHIEDVKFR